MKIALISDLHLEFKASKLLTLNQRVNVLVLAGDVHSAKHAVFAAINIANGLADHIVLIAGNHEFYGDRLDKGYARLQADAAQHSNVHFLQNASVTLHNRTFHGATLWTNYALYNRASLDMLRAESYMNDHRRIKFKQDAHTYRRFLPIDALHEHAKTRAYLNANVKPNDIVVTHHAPTSLSIHPRYANPNELNSAYASDLATFIETHRPALWFHGHMHDPCDYTIYNTRVVANPRGYPGERQDNPQILYMDIQ